MTDRPQSRPWPCPDCSALAGEPCRYYDGSVHPDYLVHAGRIRFNHGDLRKSIRDAIDILEHTSDHHATDARLTLIAAASSGDETSDRWLRCSTCHRAVPESDATVICIECSDGMAFTANAAASEGHRPAIGGWPPRLWWRFWLGRIQGWLDR